MLIAGCSIETEKDIDYDRDELMREHCKSMPDMPGCEPYVKSGPSTLLEVSSPIGDSTETQGVVIEDGGSFDLSAEIVTHDLGNKKMDLFAYNSQIPGPLIKVRQGSEIRVNFTNNLDVPTAVHWHGLRVENRYDGVPGLTQDELAPGESFEYLLRFPDPGVYWYHPHVREDYQQEMGLYGNIIVEPEQEDYFPEVDKEEFLFLDDMLFYGNDLYPFYADRINNAVMGRFGNVMLINGKTDYSLEVRKGEVVRFYLTNAANTRTFNFSIEGVNLKLIGSDSGAYEKEVFVDSVIISPSERYIVEAYFDELGQYEIFNKNPFRIYEMGTISVTQGPSQKDHQGFEELSENRYVVEEMKEFEQYYGMEPDVEMTLSIDIGGMPHSMNSMMHPEESVEWEDVMPMMRSMTNESVRWVIRDEKSGRENMDIGYGFEVGDKVKISLYNDPESMHPMQHPIHFHGQRFLILEEDGVKNENLVWKDTVLVPIGSRVDILLDVTNPGDWLAHCHIAEHMHSGMMMVFDVKEVDL